MRRPHPLRILVRRFGRLVFDEALDLIAPAHCPACGAWSERTGPPTLCSLCRPRLRATPDPARACRRCGEAASARFGCTAAGHRHLRGLWFAAAPWRYPGTAGALVRRLKFSRDLAAGSVLASGMARRLRAAIGEAGQELSSAQQRRLVLVPVPLHRRRRRERGFDQALWLADRIGERLGLRVSASLVRVRATTPQGNVLVTSRERNVADAFAPSRSSAVIGGVAGRDVVLVDDVTTSGATGRACARVLRASGARRVALLTAARARSGDDDDDPAAAVRGDLPW